MIHDDIDYWNNFDLVFCQELGDMCDTRIDCVFCLYRVDYG